MDCANVERLIKLGTTGPQAGSSGLDCKAIRGYYSSHHRGSQWQLRECGPVVYFQNGDAKGMSSIRVAWFKCIGFDLIKADWGASVHLVCVAFFWLRLKWTVEWYLRQSFFLNRARWWLKLLFPNLKVKCRALRYVFFIVLWRCISWCYI